MFDFRAARRAISSIVRETPVLEAPQLEPNAAVPIGLKLENLQVTGSFKVRGAANRLLALDDGERARGVVTCSSGNHGRAVSYVAKLLGVPAVVCVPEWVDPTKAAAMHRSGAEVVIHGATYDEAEARSHELCNDRGLTYVDPFDDPLVIAGQGTIGLELLDQVPLVDVIAVPLSGGGLLGGIASAIKQIRPQVHVVGVSADRSRVMLESVRAGHQVSMVEQETIASALSGGIGASNTYTLPLIRDLVDEHVVAVEEDIKWAMAFAARELKLVVEGGGAVALAALLSGTLASDGRRVVALVSGGNVDQHVLAQVIQQFENRPLP